MSGHFVKGRERVQNLGEGSEHWSTLPDAKDICETHREQVVLGGFQVTDGLEKMHFSVLHILWFIVFLSETGFPYSLSRPSLSFSSACKPAYVLTCPTLREGLVITHISLFLPTSLLLSDLTAHLGSAACHGHHYRC